MSLTVMGVDSSSVGVAWACVDEEGFVDYDKVNLTKYKEAYDRIYVIYEEFGKVFKEHNPDILVVEQAIYLNNANTAKVLSYIVGAVYTTAIANGAEQIFDIPPQVWKSWLGYKNVSGKFVSEAKKKVGARDGAKLCNQLRKSQTYNVIRHNYPEFGTADDDIADAAGIALWAYNKYVSPLALEISHSIAVDQETLARLGLTF